MWSQEKLWKKAEYYMDRARETDDPDRELFKFWSLLGYEFVARAALANNSPTLLADTKSGHEQLFHALGLPTKLPARSLPAAEVFRFCMLAIPEFTKGDYEHALKLLDVRNEELHTGLNRIGSLRDSFWLPGFYRGCKILAESQKKNLRDLFAPKQAAAAEQRVGALASERRGEANELIKEAKERFEAQSVEDRLEAIKKWHAIPLYKLGEEIGFRSGHTEKCPACGARARVQLVTVRESKVTELEGHLYQDMTYLPVKLACGGCGLEIDGHELLHAIGLGDEVTDTETYEPEEYFELPEREPEPDDF